MKKYLAERGIILKINSSMSLAEQAYIKLERMIITLELKPGAIVSENEISHMLGIGRMPIREAFKRLESSGLVSIAPRRGILINEIKTEEIFLQLEVRAALEDLIVKRACKYATVDERNRLLKLAIEYEEATKSNNRDYAIRIDDEFNQLIGACSKNPFASQAITPFYALLQRIYYYNYETNEALTLEINDVHIELMKIIASGNEQRAIEKLKELLKYNERLIRSSMTIWFPEELN